LHKDFHVTADIGISYVGENYGDDAVKEYLTQYAKSFYKLLVEEVKKNGLKALEDDFINVYRKEECLEDLHVELTEDALKDLHQILMNDVNRGGLYRNVDISIKGSNHTPPSHIKVYDRMKKYFDTINQDGVELYEQIAFSHLQLAKIHPFLDGNGRCARLVLNYNLLKNGLKPIIIEANKKDEYFNYLEEFKVNKDILPFINFLKNNQ
jgi:Fic family protein